MHFSGMSTRQSKERAQGSRDAGTSTRLPGCYSTVTNQLMLPQRRCCTSRRQTEARSATSSSSETHHGSSGTVFSKRPCATQQQRDTAAVQRQHERGTRCGNTSASREARYRAYERMTRAASIRITWNPALIASRACSPTCIAPSACSRFQLDGTAGWHTSPALGYRLTPGSGSLASHCRAVDRQPASAILFRHRLIPVYARALTCSTSISRR